jgi:O-antigen/teichoic acid export membrane protein
MSRTRNSAWNAAAGLTYTLASAATSFFATPLLLRWLGSERLGAYRALTDWIGYLTLLELGLGGALMAALAVRLGQSDRGAVTRTLAAGLRAYCQVMLAQLVGGMALVIALPHIIALDRLSNSELRIAGAVGLLPVLLTPLLVFRVLAETRQRSYLNWLLMTAQVLMMTCFSLLAARLGWGLVGQSVAFAVAQVPTSLVLLWDGTRLYREAWKAAPEQADRITLGGLRWPTFIHGLTDRVGLVSDNIVIAWILGPAAVVPFSLTQQLAVLVQSQLRVLGQATWAGLAELYARGDGARLRSRLLELTGMVSGLGMAVLIPIAVCNRSFISIWVGQEAYAGDLVTGLACLNALLWSIYSLWGWVLLGTGHIRRWVPFSVLSALLNVVVSVIGTAIFGITGPLLGTASGLLLITSWSLPRTLHNVVGISPWTLWRAALAPFRWCLPFAIILRAVVGFYYPGGWLGILGFIGLSSAGGLALWWSFTLGRDERLEWRARLKSVALLR